MNRSAAHHALRNEILIAIGMRPGVFAHKYDPVEGELVVRDRKTKKKFSVYVSTGTPGYPDIAGWVSVPGCPALWFGIEVKTGAAVRNQNQMNFHARAERDGSFITVAHNVAEAVAFIDSVQSKAREIAALLTRARVA